MPKPIAPYPARWTFTAGLGLVAALTLPLNNLRAQSISPEQAFLAVPPASRDDVVVGPTTAPPVDGSRALLDTAGGRSSSPPSLVTPAQDDAGVVSGEQALLGVPRATRTRATSSSGGAMTTMTAPSTTAAPDAASDPRIDPRVRTFLADLNKDSSPFWELPGPQVRATLTGLQEKTPVDLSGITIAEKTIQQDGRSVKLYIVKPNEAQGTPPVILFIHGGVWIAGNFENHKRFVRDLVVGSCAAAVFVEYTPIPDAVYPTQIEESYAAAKWVAAHGAEIGVDGTRMAVAGNSVGGDMAAVVAMMAKDRGGPNIRFQLLFWPATDANFQTDSYRAFETGRFLPRAFMEFGWNIYAPKAETRKEPYAAPLQASVDQLRGLPPALIQTADNDVLRDEGEAYGHRLSEAGVEVTSTRYIGQIHDFGLLNGIKDVPSTQAALRQASGELARYLTH
jgi:acetyl esterase